MLYVEGFPFLLFLFGTSEAVFLVPLLPRIISHPDSAFLPSFPLSLLLLFWLLLLEGGGELFFLPSCKNRRGGRGGLLRQRLLPLLLLLPLSLFLFPLLFSHVFAWLARREGGQGSLAVCGPCQTDLGTTVLLGSAAPPLATDCSCCSRQ